jgi:hypothetical protein
MSADIDIDCADRDRIIQLIDCTAASMLHSGKIKKHNSGIYATNIPYDPVNECSSILYEEAESRGYFKIDLLNVQVYKMIRDNEHYEKLLNQEPKWDMLWQDKKVTEQIVHVGNYYDLLKAMQPDSVIKMAAFISIIRPGKAHLQRKPWDEVLSNVWDGELTDGYTFRKSHSISYAMLVKINLNQLSEKIK